VRVEELHADVVHVDAPVDEALHVRLGDDERLRLAQERHDLRGHGEIAAPAAQDVHARVAQDAEPRRLDGFRGGGVGGEAVFPHAEQRHVVGGGPFEESDSLADFPPVAWWRVGLEVGDRIGQPLPHAREIRDGLRHMRIDRGQPGLQVSGFRG
jgi:hypothetical protein